MAVNKGTRLLLWVTGLGILILSVMVVAVALLWDPEAAPTADGTWLEVKLAGPLSDGPPEDAYVLDPEQAPLYLTDVAAVISAAAADDGVEGIYLNLESPQIGMAGAQELRAALGAFTAAGKPCKAWSKSLTNATWYLASACPELLLHPEGVPMVLGLSIETMYYAGLMEEYGVSAEYVSVGEYKSAVESYLREGPSEAAVEMYEALMDSLFSQLVEGAAAGWPVPPALVSGEPLAVSDEALAGPVLTAERGEDGEIVAARASRWTPAEVRALIDDPPMTARAAEERGLVDGLVRQGELEDALEELGGTTSLRDYAGGVRRGWQRGPRVAIIHLQGTIMDGHSSSGGLGGSSIGDRTAVEYLEQVREDDDVAAVVVRVDSPGGSDVIWREVARTDEVKPVIASMSSYAASGGYYIAMGARHVVAEPATLTGSIGVYGGKFALAGLYERFGLSTWSIERGALAGMNSLTDPWTEAERAAVQARMQEFYKNFVTRAAESRGVSYEALDSVARGRVWTGAQGVNNGLVDELGGLEVAVRRAAEEAGLEGEYGRMILPRQSTLFEALLEMTEPPDASVAALELLGPEAAEGLGRALVLGQILASEGLAAAPPSLPVIR